MRNIIKLPNKNCTSCPFKKLDVISFNSEIVIKSCTQCNNK